MEDGIISEEAGRLILTPFHDVLFAVVSQAFVKWRGVMFKRPSARARATVIQEYLMEEARDRLGAFDALRIIEPQPLIRRRRDRDRGRGRRPPASERFLVAFPKGLVAQFKKLDPDFKTRNYPTAAARLFDDQRPLAGVPVGTRITVGYQLDAAAQQIATVAIVCQGLYRPRWWYELAIDDEAGAVTPMTPTSPLPPAKVLPKKQLDIPLEGEGKKKA